MTLLFAPVVSVLGGIYAKNYGLSLSEIAVVMLVARVFDAVSDPVVGLYSDQFKARTGTRKPFLVAGAVLMIPASYFLFSPPEDVGVLYFTFWYIAFYQAMTLYVIPSMAWVNEFTENSSEKTLVFGFIAGASNIGSILFYLLPFLPHFSSTEINPETLRVTVLLGAVLLAVGVYTALKIVPNDACRKKKVKYVSRSLSFKKKISTQFFALKTNEPFLIYLCAFSFLGLGVGMWTSLFFIYVDAYLKLGDDFAKISVWGMVCGLGSIPVWYRLSIFFGRQKAWLTAMALLIFGFVFTSVLKPGQVGSNSLFILNSLMIFAITSINIFAYPMLCDVVDYGRLKDNIERSAFYFSIQGLFAKMQFAIGGSLGFGILGWFGFNVHDSIQTKESLFGMHMAIAWLPALLVLVSMILISLMPLNEHRMAIIRRRFHTRSARLKFDS
jgi:Na+/melibiose symporter-like transporter